MKLLMKVISKEDLQICYIPVKKDECLHMYDHELFHY